MGIISSINASFRKAVELFDGLIIQVFAINKGKLSFNKHITKNIVHKEKFFVQHRPYQKDHLLNQILLKAIKLIPEITNLSPLRDRGFQAAYQFS